MPHDYRPAHHQNDHARPHRRKPQRRTSNRETVQSDELSSTNGIRMVKDAQSFNHDRNPHLSQTSLPTIGAVGTPHPKSPAARAMQQQARPEHEMPGFGIEEAPFESTGVRTHGAGNPLYTGETYPVRGTHTEGSLPPAHVHDQQTNASLTGSHRATQAVSSDYPTAHASQSSRFRTVPPASDYAEPRARERPTPPTPGRDRTLGIPRASPQSSTRKLHRSPTTTRTTLLQVGVTKHPTHKLLHLRISSRSLPPRSTRVSALKHGRV